METTRSQIELKRGMVSQFLKYYKCTDPNSMEYKSMIRIMDCLIELLQKRLPFSDDLLLLCYHFELSQMKQVKPLQTKIWKTITKVCDRVLKLPLNRRDWLWFKQYLMPSVLLHEEVARELTEEEKKIQEQQLKEREAREAAKAKKKKKKHDDDDDDDDDDDEKEDKKKKKKATPQVKKDLLYIELVKIVKEQLKAQVEYLKKPIIALENETNKKVKEAWDQLKNYPEYIVCLMFILYVYYLFVI